MRIKLIALFALVLVGLGLTASNAQAQYHGGYHGYYPSCGYRGGCGYSYGYGHGYYGCGFNNTTGILFGASAIINAIGTSVAINNNQPWNQPPPASYYPPTYQAPAPAPATQTVVHVIHTSDNDSDSSTKVLPHGYADQGMIHSPWSNALVPGQGIQSGTVLFDAFTGKRYLAP